MSSLLQKRSLIQSVVARSTSTKQVSNVRTFSVLGKEKGKPLYQPVGEFKASEAQITPPTISSSTLSNGIRVVTVSSKQPTSSVGLFINAGSRNETPSNSGASFFLRHMAFRGNHQHTSLRFIRTLELLGANYYVSSGREQISFLTEVPSDQVPELLPVLSGVLGPSLKEHEVHDEIHTVEESVREIETNPRVLTLELLHQEAYRNQGLGQSLYAPAFNIHHLNPAKLSNFVKSYYTSDNLVIVATGGIEHPTFVKLVEQYFTHQKGQGTKSTPSAYFGGEQRHPGDFETHLALGFEGESLTSKDSVALGVLQHLLGSGNSYGRYGVGNGLTSRLNRNVVSPNAAWIEEASAFNFNYTDSGLFGVFAIAKRGNVSKLVDSITKELNNVTTGSISNEELSRARNQYKSSILYNTESRVPLVEFVGKQTLAKNQQIAPSDFVKAIDSVSASGLVTVAKKVFKSKPTLVVLGDVANTPTVEKISSAFKSI